MPHLAKIKRLDGLEKTYYLLWATPRGEKIPFEVSKEIKEQLQPLCSTSPYCPDERVPHIRGEKIFLEKNSKIKSLLEYIPNPYFKGVKDCPYNFRTKPECYRDINIKAMTGALFEPDEVDIYANFLKGIGYSIKLEEIKKSRIDGTRILEAHRLFNYHEVRVEFAPTGVMLCMVRNPYYEDQIKIT